MDNQEIQKANRKALPKFLWIMLLSLITGGVLGWLVAKADGIFTAEGLKSAPAWFGIQVAPWLMLLCALAEVAVCTPLYRKGKQLLSQWDGEDEALCDAAEKKLSYVLWISNCTYILSFFLLTATYSSARSTYLGNRKIFTAFLVSIAAFLAILIEMFIFQQKSVDAAKKSNPEKNVSFFDVKFQKKWMDSCDEAEKIMIGKCACKAFSATNLVCITLAGLLAVGALVFEIGFTASFSVCVIWFVNQSVYFKETMKYSKAGNKVS